MNNKLLILCASNNHNLKLATQVKSQLDKDGVLNQCLDLVDIDLPLYTPNAEKKGVPEKIKELLPLIIETEGFVVVTPEYNGGVPPVLSNFIAWLSVASENFRDCFDRKPAALMSFSGSGATILSILRLQLAYLGILVIGRQLLATYAKPAKEESIEAVLSELKALIGLSGNS